MREVTITTICRHSPQWHTKVLRTGGTTGVGTCLFTCNGWTTRPRMIDNWTRVLCSRRSAVGFFSLTLRCSKAFLAFSFQSMILYSGCEILVQASVCMVCSQLTLCLVFHLFSCRFLSSYGVLN
jgi:hypothetical protein